MLVTFISQCEKKALGRTRRVLDAFASRIGDNAWQTIITQEGLDAVAQLLRKNATRSTAVTCHWMRSRSRSQLVWVIGNKRKFNAQGQVPVNMTSQDMQQFTDSNTWQFLPLIRYAASIAGLFHDFGKASVLFQKKLNPDIKTHSFEPYRHEWVSVRLFQSFIADCQTDDQWLEKLSIIDSSHPFVPICDGLDERIGVSNQRNPMIGMPDFAQIVAWIILSHHRLPNVNTKAHVKPALAFVCDWFDKNLSSIWNSPKCDDPDQVDRIADNWTFDISSLPHSSAFWRARACTLATRARQALAQQPINPLASSMPLTEHAFSVHLARLSMMLADHYYSSKNQVESKWRAPNYHVYANTYYGAGSKKGYKQQLDEHLIGVAHHAELIVKALPSFVRSLNSLDFHQPLEEKVPQLLRQQFGWQDKARSVVKKLRFAPKKQGFFGVNMASTGKGKTLANAKIMYALGQNIGRVRFSVAMGLRTLTLQTGLAFKSQLQLTDEDLAVLVGGAPIRELLDEPGPVNRGIDELAGSGSESDQDLFSPEVDVVTGAVYAAHSLSEWTEHDQRLSKILAAPVLVSTIDHLVPATEGIAGGRQIAPMLRLLTSDLVLDEPDDFGLEDLPALVRLVHWAGLLGSRVLLSTATLPPAIAYALFIAYRKGWDQYARANIDLWDGAVACTWFDEFGGTANQASCVDEYKKYHEAFVDKRMSRLKGAEDFGRRQGEIFKVIQDKTLSIIQRMALTLYDGVLQQHSRHAVISPTGSRVSIGLVRMANIDPMISVVKLLLAYAAPEKTRIHYCVYHSRFPLALRSEIERCLDYQLKRSQKNNAQFWAKDGFIMPLLQQYPDAQEHIFVVIASPVAEVGRDHDYDWAIVEPSSMRSIIQLAGRVLRHRAIMPSAPNVLLLNKNMKALRNSDDICFNRPGFESASSKLDKHDLESVLDDEYQIISAIQRVKIPEDCQIKAKTNLNCLEHLALYNCLFNKETGAKIWWMAQPFWTGELQKQQPFRKSGSQASLYLVCESSYASPVWRELNMQVKPPELGMVTSIQPPQSIQLEFGNGIGLWFNICPETVFTRLAQFLDKSLQEVSERYGLLQLDKNSSSDSSRYEFHPSLGLFRNGKG